MTQGWWPRLRGAELVAYLDDEEHDRLLAAAELASVGPGEPILSKGSPSRSLLFIDQGEVEIVEESLGEEVVLATLGPGSVVGEVGFIDGEPRTHDVRARGACRLRRLTREKLLELVRDDPTLFAKLSLALAEILARRFRVALAEFEPLRSFAASLGQPLTGDTDPAGDYDEIEADLPEAEPGGQADAELRELVLDVARRARKRLSGL